MVINRPYKLNLTADSLCVDVRENEYKIILSTNVLSGFAIPAIPYWEMLHHPAQTFHRVVVYRSRGRLRVV